MQWTQLAHNNMAISFPEPTCLLVSAKTRSSGIIRFKSPRFWDFRFHGACVLWLKKDVQRKNRCGLLPQRHSIRIHIDFISKHLVLNQGTHAPWNWKSQNLGLLKWIIPELRVLALTKRHVGSGNEIDNMGKYTDMHFLVYSSFPSSYFTLFRGLGTQSQPTRLKQPERD